MTDRRASGKSERPSPEEGRDAPFHDERDPAERIVAGLSILGTALRAKAWEGATSLELTPTQARILTLLQRADPDGVTLAYLAGRLGVSGPTTSDSVGALEKKGLVQKRPSPSDRRALSIRLTKAGHVAAGRVTESPAELVAALDGLPSDDETTLLRVLVTLIRELETRGVIAPHRSCVTCRFFEPDTTGGAHADRPYYCAFARARFNDGNLRLDCQDHEAAEAEVVAANWAIFNRTT